MPWISGLKLHALSYSSWSYPITLQDAASSRKMKEESLILFLQNNKNFPKKNILDLAACANQLSGGFSGYGLSGPPLTHQLAGIRWRMEHPEAEVTPPHGEDCLSVCPCPVLTQHHSLSKK